MVCIKFNPNVGNIAVPHCGPKVLNNATANAACTSPSNQFGNMDGVEFEEESDVAFGALEVDAVAAKYGRKDEMYSPKLMTFQC